MIITYQGLESFKIQFGDTIIAYNPISKDSKLKSSRFGADIALVSANHPDLNGVEQTSRGEKESFAITGPGEYEIGGIFIQGFPSTTTYGGKEMINTVYKINLEGMNLCLLGALESPDSISAETKEELDDIDILFVPIGGSGVLEPSSAYKLSVKLEPKIIIPMHYEDGASSVLKTFLKEGGEEKVSPIDKLTVKRKDLEGKEGDIVVISPSN